MTRAAFHGVSTSQRFSAAPKRRGGKRKGNLISYRQRDSRTSLTCISSLKSDYMCTAAVVHAWVQKAIRKGKGVHRVISLPSLFLNFLFFLFFFLHGPDRARLEGFNLRGIYSLADRSVGTRVNLRGTYAPSAISLFALDSVNSEIRILLRTDAPLF